MILESKLYKVISKSQNSFIIETNHSEESAEYLRNFGNGI